MTRRRGPLWRIGTGLVGIGLCLTAGLGKAASLEADRLYALYFGIAPIGDAVISRSVQKTKFRLIVKARPDGVARLFSDETWSLSASGFRTSDGFESSLYQTKSRGSERKRNVRVNFSHGGGPKVTMDPPDKHAEDRSPVPDYLLPAARDPLTTALRAAEQLEETGTCQGRHLIYDGIHLFYLTLTNKGPSQLEHRAGYVGGMAHRCELRVKPVGGYRKKYEKERAERMDDAEEEPPSVWYRSLTPGAIPDIVRIEIPTQYGSVTALLHDNTPAPQDASQP